MCIMLFGGVGAAMGAPLGSMSAAVLGTSAVGLFGASTAASVASPIMAGIQASEAAKMNAKLMGEKAKSETAVGASKAAEAKERARLAASSQITQAAGSGIKVGSGTAADIVEETDKLGMLNAMTIRNNVARAAWGIQSQATLDEAAGDQAKTQGYMKGTTSALSSMSDFAFASAKYGWFK